MNRHTVAASILLACLALQVPPALASTSLETGDTTNDKPAPVILAQGFGGFSVVQPRKKNILSAQGIRKALKAAINCARQSVDEIVMAGIETAITKKIDMSDVADVLSDVGTCGKVSNAKKTEKAKDLLNSIGKAACAQQRAARIAGQSKATYATVYRAKAVTRNGWSDKYEGVVNRMGPNNTGDPIWQAVLREGKSMKPPFQWNTGGRDFVSFAQSYINSRPTKAERDKARAAFKRARSAGPPQRLAFFGRTYASHAEVKMSQLRPNKPIGVSRAMCSKCQRYMRRLAKHRGHMQAVADPKNLHIFDSAGKQRKFKNPGCKKR